MKRLKVVLRGAVMAAALVGAAALAAAASDKECTWVDPKNTFTSLYLYWWPRVGDGPGVHVGEGID